MYEGFCNKEWKLFVMLTRRVATNTSQIKKLTFKMIVNEALLNICKKIVQWSMIYSFHCLICKWLFVVYEAQGPSINDIYQALLCFQLVFGAVMLTSWDSHYSTPFKVLQTHTQWFLGNSYISANIIKNR